MRAYRRFRNVAVLLVLVPGVSALSVVPAQAGQAVRPAPAGAVPSAHSQQLGSAVALTSSLAAVGAPYWVRQSGRVYVYTRHGAGFDHQATIPDPAGDQAFFGSALALSGQRLAIVGDGKVFVYHREGAKWKRQVTFIDFSATSVALSGRTIVIGASNLGGSAWIYRWSRGAWRFQKVIHDPRGPAVNWFGGPVAISGSTVVVGGVDVAVIYARSGSHWARQATLTGYGSYFGSGLGISGSTVVVGAWGAYHNKGVAYFYQRAGHSWRRVATFRDPNTAPYTAFGDTAAVSGNRALVGAPSPFAGSIAPRCGSVYEYARSAGRWRYRAKVANPGCRRGDQFGLSIALLGQTALIGAPTKNHNQGGVFETTVP